jgi:ribosome-binding factor A
LNSPRLGRVADRVRRILARAIQTELRDPRVGFVTLTDVRLSPDLQHAVAFVTVLGAERREPALRALNHAVPFLRRTLAREAGLRHTPQLRFAPDDALERALRLEELFEELREKRERQGEES